jgi:hypothetical protein
MKVTTEPCRPSIYLCASCFYTAWTLTSRFMDTLRRLLCTRQTTFALFL